MNHGTHTTPADDRYTERSIAAAFEAIRTRRRRVMLNRLAGRDTVEIATLATKVAVHETTDADSDGVSADAIETALRHADLPKLEDLGFVAVDLDRDVVRLCPSPTLSSLLAIAAEADATA